MKSCFPVRLGTTILHYMCNNVVGIFFDSCN